MAALTSAVSDALQGNPINYTVVITAFTTGIGLLNARDNKVSSEQAGIK